MPRKGRHLFKRTIDRARGWRTARRSRFAEHKHQANRSGSSDNWNHMYRGGG